QVPRRRAWRVPGLRRRGAAPRDRYVAPPRDPGPHPARRHGRGGGHRRGGPALPNRGLRGARPARAGQRGGPGQGRPREAARRPRAQHARRAGGGRARSSGRGPGPRDVGRVAGPFRRLGGAHLVAGRPVGRRVGDVVVRPRLPRGLGTGARPGGRRTARPRPGDRPAIRVLPAPAPLGSASDPLGRGARGGGAGPRRSLRDRRRARPRTRVPPRRPTAPRPTDPQTTSAPPTPAPPTPRPVTTTRTFASTRRPRPSDARAAATRPCRRGRTSSSGSAARTTDPHHGHSRRDVLVP